MNKYRPIEELIDNENVIRILNNARVPGEGDLLLDMLETGEEKDVFRVYVTLKDYDAKKNDLIFLATVTKKKEKINSWYVNFKGTFKENF